MESKSFFKEMIIGFSDMEQEQVAFTIYDGQTIRSIRYREYLNDILETASYFSEHHIRGQHVALAAPNCYRWLVTFFALAASGNVIVPMNYDLPVDVFRWQLEKADVNLVCHDGSDVAEKLGSVPGLLFNDLRGSRPLAPEEMVCIGENEPALMMLTSGTTGLSKVVMLSPNNLRTSYNNVFTEKKRSSVKRENETTLLSLPLYHIGSIRMVLQNLGAGNCLAIGRGMRYTFMDMPKLNPTYVGMVPAMAESFARILRRVPEEKLPSQIGTGFQGIFAVGASMKQSVAQYLLDKGIHIEVIYGMTETAGDGAWCVLDESHFGTIGKPDGNISFRLEDGEILLRSEGVMLGYYKDPEETAKVIVDGWLRTGDMGRCDEDGYYYITGRKKNVIILGNGENVNPEEIEATFGDCPEIEESLVYSDGKGICADVFAKDRDTAAAYIKAYNENMPMYRQVYKVNYTDEPLPKTGSGKIKRKENL